MADQDAVQIAIEALKEMHGEKGDGHCFPSDEIWAHYKGELPASGKRPPLVNYLAANGYLAATGRTAKSVSVARKGAPTTEYTFGEKISPESLDMARERTSGAWSYLADPPATSASATLDYPKQRLLHGCPGSGKSYQLAKDAEQAHWVLRTVFHPETRYSDFVGGLRPVSIYRVAEGDAPKYVGADVPGEPYVHYVIQPGPMLKAYHLACANPDKSVVLLIEELSRAVAAHVFGDTLQLLDRLDIPKGSLPQGVSEYEIEPRSDIGAWLLANDVKHEHVRAGRMRFPANLYIWATMNRSDQNARQLDSAFLRRWDKQYLSYLEECAYDDAPVVYGGKTISWGVLRKAINARLQSFEGVPEDKFIGPYFLSQSKLVNAAVLAEDLWGHLWNDVLKSRAPSFFSGAATLAELLQSWDGGNGAPLGDI